MRFNKRYNQPVFSRDRWEVERERCCIETDTPRPQDDKAYPLATVIENIFSKLAMKEDLALRRLHEEWVSVAGPLVAAHSRPGRLEHGRLTVFVENSVWLSELKRYACGKLLANVQTCLGADQVKAVDLMLNPDPPPKARAR